MNENVRTAVVRVYETITFLKAEPFYGSGLHGLSFGATPVSVPRRDSRPHAAASMQQWTRLAKVGNALVVAQQSDVDLRLTARASRASKGQALSSTVLPIAPALPRNH